MKKTILVTALLLIASNANAMIEPKYSSQFIENLETCTPFNETKNINIMGMNLVVTDNVIGSKDFKCVYRRTTKLTDKPKTIECALDGAQKYELTSALKKDTSGFEVLGGGSEAQKVIEKFYTDKNICNVITPEFGQGFKKAFVTCSPVKEKTQMEMMGLKIDIELEIEGNKNGICIYSSSSGDSYVKEMTDCTISIEKAPEFSKVFENSTFNAAFENNPDCKKQTVNIMAQNISTCKEIEDVKEFKFMGQSVKLITRIKKALNDNCILEITEDANGKISTDSCEFSPAQQQEFVKYINDTEGFKKALSACGKKDELN